MPAPDNKGDTHVGVACTQSSDCQTGIDDDDTKKTYCCGTATGGKLIGTDGKVTDSTANNAVICGKTPSIEVQYGYMYNGEQVTIDYPADGFTCLQNARALVASAAVLLSAAALI